VVGSSSTIDFVALPEDDPRVRRPDTTLARQLLGWHQRVTITEGLRRTLDWFAHQHPARVR
jgi:dTDP-glucose 4,6-dehydratase